MLSLTNVQPYEYINAWTSRTDDGARRIVLMYMESDGMRRVLSLTTEQAESVGLPIDDRMIVQRPYVVVENLQLATFINALTLEV